MSEAKPEGPTSHNPVEYNEDSAGGRFLVAVRVHKPDPCGDPLGCYVSERIIGTHTGWQQWQWGGRGYSYLYEFEDGSRRWSTDMGGDAFVLKRISKGGSK
tara:strand:+ start:2312 stop:2614 length:303 start_codon:yes stop_codon:yes gene_type:complete